jgi:hypothetical protein
MAYATDWCVLIHCKIKVFGSILDTRDLRQGSGASRLSAPPRGPSQQPLLINPLLLQWQSRLLGEQQDPGSE